MSIPYVRYVQSEDDGCAQWQCLNCYAKWISQTLVRNDWPNARQWKYCPYCGLEWVGERKWDVKRKWEHGHGLTTSWPDERLRPLKFCLEELFIPFDSNQQLDFANASNWQKHCGGLRDARVAMTALKEVREEQEKSMKDNEIHFGILKYRIVPQKEK